MGDITEKVDIVINESGGRTVKRSLDDIADSAQRGVQPVNKLNSSLDIFYGSLKALGGIIATLKLSSLINEAASLSQRYNELGIVLGVVGRNAGLTRSEVDATTESVRKQGISMIESRQIVTRMIQSQIDLSKATELARLAQDAAVIGQMNSSQALDTLVHGIQSAQVDVLRTIGLNVNFEQSYAKLAKEMGVTQNALTENEKLQARLNVVLGEASKISGVYEGAMANAGKQMRSTQRLVEDLKVKVGGLFDQTSIFAVTAYTNALKEADSSVENFTQTGQLKAWGDSVARIAAFAADSIRSVGIVFDITGKAIGAMAAQAVAVSKFDFGTAIRIQGDFNKDFDSAVASMSKMRDLVESQIIERDLLTKAAERETLSLKSNSVELGKNTEEAKKDIDARNRFIQALQTEVDSIGLNEFAIKRMEAAKLGATKAASPLIDALEAENKRLNLQSIQVNQITSDLNKYKQVTESVKTDQEKFSDTVEELNRLKNLTNGAAISQETYNRALKKANDELLGVKKTGNETFDALNQYTIQAARNIQTSFANFLFDPFQDGVKGMLTSFLNAIRRMVAEVAASRIANAIGLNSMLGINGTAATGTASAGASSGLSMLNIASLGSSVMSGIRGGFGIPSVIGNMGMSLPGSIGSFFGGMAGATGTQAAAEAGAMALWGSSGASAGIASGMGAGLAAAAGPLMVAFAATQAFKMLAGDKRLGGGFGKAMNFVGDIPILGDLIPIIPLINGLFGRGPMKQQGTLLEGRIGAEGFESGMLQTRFKAKGGLFRSDKIDYSRVDAVTGETFTDNGKLQGFTAELAKAGAQLFGVINDATKQTSSTLRGVAKDLGLATSGIDDFSYSLSILTDKGKMLTEEQIGKEIENITDGLARSLLPQVDELAKRGETALQTVSRLGAEFTTLVDAATLLFSKTGEQSKAFVNQFGFSDRTAFLDKAGGADAFGAMVSGFARNFLTDDQLMKPVIESLVSQRNQLGLSGINNRAQYVSAVQSGNLNQDQLLFLLKNQDAINSVFTYLEKISQAAPEAATGLAAVSRELNIADADRTEYGQRLNKGIQETTAAIAELEGIAKQLMGTVNQINPLSINEARGIVSSGNANDPRLQTALSTLSDMGTGEFSNVIDFQRAKAQNVAAISNLQNSITSQIATKNKELTQFNFEKLMLQEGLQRAAQMFSEAASFDVGGYVPRTGMAIIHKDEQVLTPGQQDRITSEIAQMREELGKALAAIAKHTEKTATLIDDVSAGGTAMLTEAA